MVSWMADVLTLTGILTKKHDVKTTKLIRHTMTKYLIEGLNIHPILLLQL